MNARGTHFTNRSHAAQLALATWGPVPGSKRGTATTPQVGQSIGGTLFIIMSPL